MLEWVFAFIIRVFCWFLLLLRPEMTDRIFAQDLLAQSWY